MPSQQDGELNHVVFDGRLQSRDEDEDSCAGRL